MAPTLPTLLRCSPGDARCQSPPVLVAFLYQLDEKLVLLLRPLTLYQTRAVMYVDVLIQFRGEGASDNPNPSDSDGGQNTV